MVWVKRYRRNENEKEPSMTFRKILQMGQRLSWNKKQGILKWRAWGTDVHNQLCSWTV